VSSSKEVNNYFKIQIPKEGLYYLTLSQDSSRIHSHSSDYEYSPLSLVLSQIKDADTFEYIQGVYKSEREVYIRFQCSKPAEYLVYAGTNWKTSIRNFTISMYGPEEAKFSQVSETAFVNG
jgi:hypothetical protein